MKYLQKYQAKQEPLNLKRKQVNSAPFKPWKLQVRHTQALHSDNGTIQEAKATLYPAGSVLQGQALAISKRGLEPGPGLTT